MARGPTGTLRIARILDIPIYVHYSWLIAFGLVTWSLSQGYFPEQYPNLPVSSYWAKGLVSALLLFASVLFHELGHSVVAIRNGVGIVSITLFIFGGVARLKTDPPTPWVELKVAIAGPVASFLLAGFFFALTKSAGQHPVPGYLAFTNFVLGAFNLVPAFPLDGGRVLRAIAWKFTSKVRATRIASTAGSLFAYLFIFNGILGLLQGAGISGLWWILIGWFLKSVAEGTYQQVRLDTLLSGVRVSDLMVTDCKLIPSHLSIRDAVDLYFLRYGYGGFPVSDGARISGILSFSDIRGVPEPEWPQTSVQAVMSRLDERSSIGADRDVLEALGQMAASGLGRLIVVDEARRPVGLITHNGILRRLQMQEQIRA